MTSVPWPRISISGAIAVNDVAEPSLLVRRDPSTGRQRTIVRKDVTTTSIFEDAIVKFAVENTEDALQSRLDSLSVAELKGLLNEIITIHVADGTRLYHQTKADVEKLNRDATYSSLGPAENDAEKELDYAYRQLVNRMERDTNGGTQDAKAENQRMKLLKCPSGEAPEAPDRGKENCENREGYSENIKADGHETKPKEVLKIPQQATLAELLAESNRPALDEAARHYLTVLKSIRTNVSILKGHREKIFLAAGAAHMASVPL